MYFFPFLEWFINHISQMIIRLTTQMSLPFKVSTTVILCVHPKFLACCSTTHLSFWLHDSYFLCTSYNSLLSVFYKRCTLCRALVQVVPSTWNILSSHLLYFFCCHFWIHYWNVSTASVALDIYWWFFSSIDHKASRHLVVLKTELE